ncbi:uncharacterized protein TRUGW13939_00602 [Talaromyces rugulosus]|uniref:Uncharacterized protein n=1 Tax=Talaromyces rugulosus TaxID=121627 RepID=A0A7H8QJW9_TALRU|nr:uncharacterized protein TRUGW13939_00602 [Talaromyces rugulosus]QKX53523.1 hypothetical protein TRUGW13939_00602 [Talaromyces rugulosus]
MSDLSNMAYQAERDLNSHQKKTGSEKQSDSTLESGVNENVQRDFPGADVQYGERANYGGSETRKIPPEQGGDFDARGRMTESRQFEGTGGPEDKLKIVQERRPGDDGVPVQSTNF